MANNFSRRTFARLLGVTAGTASLPAFGSALGSLGAAREPAPGTPHRFPEGFVWGSATASYQVEGAVHADGRGVSIWDTFSHTPGKTFEGETGDIADDDYHLYKEDVRLMKDLGLHACRFSIAWPRIFPNGTGTPNPKGLDFYNRVVDELLAHGIQPFCTLYHWDLPQALQDKNGGWQSRDTSEAFAHYAGYVTSHLSDRVGHFMTTNEIRTFTELGYSTGRFAPGLRLDEAQFAQVCHNAVLGHGLAVQAVRANSRRSTQVGLAENITAITPVLNTPEHIEAAMVAMREDNAPYMTVIQEGRYTDAYLKRLGPSAPKFTPEDLKIISSKLDFSGINIYQPTYVRADGSEQGYAIVPPPQSFPHMYSPWITVGPEALYWAPKIAAKLWNIPAVYITENGASSCDTLTPEGTVLDTDRVMFVRNYLTHLHRGVSEGVPVKGYFLWSLLDNYEWADGYEKRFGIHYVDFKTQKRTPKLSAAFYKDVIARNALG